MYLFLVPPSIHLQWHCCPRDKYGVSHQAINLHTRSTSQKAETTAEHSTNQLIGSASFSHELKRISRGRLPTRKFLEQDHKRGQEQVESNGSYTIRESPIPDRKDEREIRDL